VDRDQRAGFAFRSNTSRFGDASNIGGYGKARLRICAHYIYEPGSRFSIPNNLDPELDSKTYYEAICKKFKNHFSFLLKLFALVKKEALFS
jgi:hypothetical protein